VRERDCSRIAEGDLPANAVAQPLETEHVACREAADAQLAVATVLRSRPVSPLPAGFAERVAARLAVESGWLGLADWRVWTFRFAPLAAATAIVVLVLGGGAGPTGFSLASLVETWTAGDSSSGRPAASLFLENDVPGDALLLTVLTEGPDDVVDTTPATWEGAR
jgi:hypothetical protein